jgi:hypothetical protein
MFARRLLFVSPLVLLVAVLASSMVHRVQADVPCSAHCGGTCCEEQTILCTTFDCGYSCKAAYGNEWTCDDDDSQCYDGTSDSFCCNVTAGCIFLCDPTGRVDKVVYCFPTFDPECPF